jgi:hypothetical protein
MRGSALHTSTRTLPPFATALVPRTGRCTDSHPNQSATIQSLLDPFGPPPDMHLSLPDLNVWSFRIDVTFCDVDVWAVDINVWPARIDIWNCHINVWKCCVDVTLCDIII